MFKVTEDGKRVTAQSEEVLNLLSVVAFDDQRKCSFPQNGTRAIPVNSRTGGPKSGTFRSGTAAGGSTAGAQGSCGRVPWRKRSAKVPYVDQKVVFDATTHLVVHVDSLDFGPDAASTGVGIEINCGAPDGTGASKNVLNSTVTSAGFTEAVPGIDLWSCMEHDAHFFW